MRIKWTQDVNLLVHDSEEDTFTENVKVGELDDVSLVDEKEYTVDMQFGCGGVSFGVNRDWFEVVTQD